MENISNRKELLQRWKIPLLLLAVLFFSYLAFQATYVALPTKKNPIRFYSTESHDNLYLLYSRAIKNAKKSVHLTIYSLTDQRIIRILENKAKEGIPVSIYYDSKGSSNLFKLFSEKVFLYPVKTKGLMHKKILVIDDKRIFIGSANLTPSSLQMHSNLIMGIRHPELARKIQNKDFSSYATLLADHPLELYFLPNPTTVQIIYHHLLQAKESIHLAMFTLTHPKLIEALVEAKKKGIDVQVALDAQTARGASQKIVEKLKMHNIPVLQNRGRSLFHHKWVCIDEKTVLLGSANWTKSAFTKNQDCFLVLEKLTTSEKKWIKKVWNTILMESIE